MTRTPKTYPPCPICKQEAHPAMARRYNGCCNDQCEEIQFLRRKVELGDALAKAIKPYWAAAGVPADIRQAMAAKIGQALRAYEEAGDA